MNIKEFKAEDIFEIFKITSFNKENLDLLSEFQDYDYITRTSFERGICCTTGYIGDEGLNKAGTFSLGLIQMDFFYRERDWYAGQFMRKIVCKFDISFKIAIYLEAVLNGLSEYLKSVLVRDVDKTFLNAPLFLPVTSKGDLDFDYMEEYITKLEAEFIAELEAKRVQELKAYMSVSGLDNFELTEEDKNTIKQIKNVSVEIGK